MLELVALAAIAALPLTIWVLSVRDERAFRALMEGQAKSIDRLLEHAAATQAPGEPAAVTKQRLDVMSEEVKARVDIARASGAWDPMRDS